MLYNYINNVHLEPLMVLARNILSLVELNEPLID